MPDMDLLKIPFMPGCVLGGGVGKGLKACPHTCQVFSAWAVCEGSVDGRMAKGSALQAMKSLHSKKLRHGIT